MDIVEECMKNMDEVRKRFDQLDITYKTRQPQKIKQRQLRSVNFQKILPALDISNTVSYNIYNEYWSSMKSNMKNQNRRNEDTTQSDRNFQMMLNMVDRRTQNHFQTSKSVQSLQMSRGDFIDQQIMQQKKQEYRSSKMKAPQSIDFNVELGQTVTDRPATKVTNIQEYKFLENFNLTTFRITNLHNYKLEPLTKYDMRVMDESEIEKIVIKKLLENNVVYGYTRYINIDRQTAWLPCDIMKYSQFEKKYQIRFHSEDLVKWVTRPNLIFNEESLDEFNKRFDDAGVIRKEQLFNKGIQSKLIEEASNFDILIEKKFLLNMVQRTFTSENFHLKEFWSQRVIEQCIDQYKQYVLWFVVFFQNEKSLMDYYQKFLPYDYELKLKKKRPIKNVTYVEINEVPQETHYDTLQAYCTKVQNDLNKNFMGTTSIQKLDSRAQVLQIVVKILDSLTKIKHIELFQGFSEVNSKGIVDAGLIQETLVRVFKSDQDKLETFIFRVEKSIDKLAEDVKDSYHTQTEKTLKFDKINFLQFKENFQNQLSKTSNVYLTSCLHYSIEFSYVQLNNYLQKYYLILPISNLQSLESLPNDMRRQIYAAKKLFSLESEESEDLSHNTIITHRYQKQQLVFNFVFQQIITQCLAGNKALLENPPQKQLGLSSIFQINLKVLKKTKKQQTPYNMFKHIIEQRAKIYQSNSQSKNILYDIFRQNFQEYPCQRAQFEEKIKNREVSLDRLGWFSFKSLKINLSPKLENIEFQLKTAFDSVLNKIQNMEEVYGFFTKRKLNLDEVIHYKQDFQAKINDFLETSFIGPLALTWLFNLFEFYLYEKNYMDQFLEIFHYTNNSKFMQEERIYLMKDLEFLRNSLPDSFCFGFFQVDVKEVKTIIVQSIEKNISIIDKSLNERIETILKESQDKVYSLISILNQHPTTIPKYIEQVQFLSENVLKEKIIKIQLDLYVCENIFKIMEKFCIPFKEKVYYLYLYSLNWSKQLKLETNIAKDLLHTLSPSFQKMIHDQKKQILTNFDSLKDQIEKFHHELDISKAPNNLLIARRIEEQLNDLIENSISLNKQREFMKISAISLKAINEEIHRFKQYIDLWELAEKIRYRSETWLTQSFTQIDMVDVIDTCREGTHIVNNLEKQSQFLQELSDDHKQNYQIILTQLNEQIQKFNQHIPLFALLREPSFKEKQWKQLFEIMYVSKAPPLIHSVNLNQLLNNKLPEYYDQIVELSVKAKTLMNIEQNFLSLEMMIKEFQFKLVYVDLYDKSQYMILKGYSNFRAHLKELILECQLMEKTGLTDFMVEKLILNQIMIRSCRRIMKRKIKLQNLILELFYVVMVVADDSKAFVRIKEDNRKFNEALKRTGLGHFLQYVDKQEKQVTEGEHEEIEKIQTNIKILESYKKEIQTKLQFQMSNQPRLYMLPESLLTQLVCEGHLQSNTKRMFLLMFPNIKSCDIHLQGQNVVLNSVSTYYDEDIFSTEDIIFPFIIKNNERFSFGIEQSSLMMESQYKAIIKRNILQHLKIVADANYDLNRIWKYLQIRSLYFQSLILILDICFAHDLTIMLLDCQDSVVRNKFILFSQHLQDQVNLFQQQQIKTNKKIFNKQLYFIFNQVILKISYYRDILEYFCQVQENSPVEYASMKLDSFEYLALPKYTLEFEVDTVYQDGMYPYFKTNQTNNEGQQWFFKSLYHPGDLYEQLKQQENKSILYEVPQQSTGICLQTLIYRLPYSYDIMDNLPLFVGSMQNDRNILWMAQALGSGIPIVNSSRDNLSFKMLACMLGQAYFEFKNVDNISTIFNIVQGLIKGKFFIQVNIDPAYVMLLSSELTKQKHQLLKLGADCLSQFNLCLNINGEFKSIDHFRVVNIVKPDYMTLIKHLLMLMGLDQSVSRGILTLFGYLQQSYFQNMQRNDVNQKHYCCTSKNLTDILGLKQITRIIRQCIDKMRMAQDNEDQLDAYDTLKYVLDQYFKNLYNKEMFELYQQLFSRVLPMKATLKFTKYFYSIRFLDTQQDKYTLDLIRECQLENRNQMTSTFAKSVYNFCTYLKHGRLVSLVGSSRYEIKQMIKFGAHVHSRVLNTVFLVHFFNGYHPLINKLLDEDPDITANDTCSRPSKLIDVQSKKLLKPSQDDWFIFNTQDELLIQSLEQFQIQGMYGDMQKFPQSTRQVIQLTDISLLCPRTLTGMNIIFVNSDQFNFNEEFAIWVKQKSISNKFYERYETCLLINFYTFFESTVIYIQQQSTTQQLSKRNLYYQLVKLLEILLNEMRKKEIAHGFLDYKDLSADEKKQIFDPTQLSNLSELHFFLSHSQNDRIRRDRNISEALFIVALAYGPGIIIEERKAFTQFLGRKITEQLNLERNFNQDYAFDLLDKLNDIFTLNFDIVGEQWIEWEKYQFNDQEYIKLQTDFILNNISASEVLRLNQESKNIQSIVQQAKTDTMQVGEMRVSTANYKKTDYFVTLILAYKQKIMLCGPKWNGKSTLMQEKIALFRLKENSNVVQFSVVMDTCDRLKKYMQEEIVCQNTITAKKKTCYFFVDDCNLPNHLFLQDIQKFKGFYNNCNFNKFKQYASLVVSQNNFAIDQIHYIQMDALDIESIFDPILSIRFQFNHVWCDIEDKLQVNYMWRAVTNIKQIHIISKYFVGAQVPALVQDIQVNKIKLYLDQLNEISTDLTLSSEAQLNAQFYQIINHPEDQVHNGSSFTEFLGRLDCSQMTLQLLGVMQESKAGLQQYYDQCQDLIHLDHNLIICETQNNFEIYRYMITQCVQTITMKAIKEKDFNSKEIPQDTKVILCQLDEEDLENIFSMISESRWKIIIFTQIPFQLLMKHTMIKRWQQGSTLLYLQIPSIVAHGPALQSLVEFPSDITDVVCEEQDASIKINLASLMYYILDEECGKREEMYKQDKVYQSILKTAIEKDKLMRDQITFKKMEEDKTLISIHQQEEELNIMMKVLDKVNQDATKLKSQIDITQQKIDKCKQAWKSPELLKDMQQNVALLLQEKQPTIFCSGAFQLILILLVRNKTDDIDVEKEYGVLVSPKNIQRTLEYLYNIEQNVQELGADVKLKIIQLNSQLLLQKVDLSPVVKLLQSIVDYLFILNENERTVEFNQVTLGQLKEQYRSLLQEVHFKQDNIKQSQSKQDKEQQKLLVLQEGQDTLTQYICKLETQFHKLNSIVLKAYIFYRSGLGDERKLQLQILALYLAFCSNQTSQQTLLQRFPYQYDQIIIWTQKWSTYTLNGRGDELLYFKISQYGNNYVQQRYSYLQFFMQASVSPFLVVLDPYDYISFNDTNYFTADEKARENLIRALRNGTIYVVSDPVSSFLSEIDDLSKQWIHALNIKRLCERKSDTFEVTIFNTVVLAKQSFKMIVLSSQVINLKYALTINLMNDTEASLIQSLGDVILNNLYKDQRRSTLGQYGRAVDYHMKLYEEPYLSLLESLRNMEAQNSSSIDYFLMLPFDDYQYHISDLIEERMLLEQAIQDSYQNDDCVKTQLSQLQRLRKKQNKSQTKKQSYPSDDDDDDESEEQINKSDISSCSDEEEDEDDLQNIYYFVTEYATDNIEHLFLIPKLQRMISPFNPYLGFLVFIKQAGQSFIKQFDNLYFYKLCAIICPSLVSEPIKHRNQVYRLEKEYCFKAFSQTLGYIQSTIKKIDFDVLLVQMLREFNLKKSTHSEYFWQLMHFGGCEYTLPPHLRSLQNHWNVLEDTNNEPLSVFQMDHQYQDMQDFDVSQSKLKRVKESPRHSFQHAMSLNHNENSFSPQLPPRKRETPKVSYFRQITQKWQELKSQSPLTPQSPRKTVIDLAQIMEQEQQEQQPERPIEVEVVIAPQSSRKKTVLGMSRTIYGMHQESQIDPRQSTKKSSFRISLFNNKAINTNSRSPSKQQRNMFSKKQSQIVLETISFKVSFVLPLAIINIISRPDGKNLRMIPKNIFKVLANLERTISSHSNLKKALVTIQKDQRQIIEFMFSELSLWTWSDGLFKTPASFIPHNLSPYEYGAIMRYLKCDEYYKYTNSYHKLVTSFSPKLKPQPFTITSNINYVTITHNSQQYLLTLLQDDPLIFIGGQHSTQHMEQLVQQNKPFLIFDFERTSQDCLKLIRQSTTNSIYIINYHDHVEMNTQAKNCLKQATQIVIHTVENLNEIIQQVFQMEMNEIEILSKMDMGKSQVLLRTKKGKPQRDQVVQNDSTPFPNKNYLNDTVPYTIKTYQSRYLEARRIKMNSFYKSFNIQVYSHLFTSYCENQYGSKEPKEEELENVVIYLQKSKTKLIYNITLMLTIFKQLTKSNLTDLDVKFFAQDFVRIVSLYPTNPFVMLSKFLRYLTPFSTIMTCSLEQVTKNFFPMRTGREFTIEVGNINIPVWNGSQDFKEGLKNQIESLPKIPIPVQLLDLSINEKHQQNLLASKQINQIVQAIDNKKHYKSKKAQEKQFQDTLNQFKSLKTFKQFLTTLQGQYILDYSYIYNMIIEIPQYEEALKSHSCYKNEVQSLLTQLQAITKERLSIVMGIGEDSKLQTPRRRSTINFELEVLPFKMRIKNKLLKQVKDRRPVVAFKITGKTFAKTLQERTLKQPAFLQELENREVTNNNLQDKILNTPGGFLGIVLKNASIIQTILLNELTLHKAQDPTTMTNNLDILNYINRGEFLKNIFHNKEGQIRDVIHVSQLLDPLGLLMGLIYSHSVQFNIQPQQLKFKLEKQRTNSFFYRQDYRKGIYLDGMKMYNGSINPINDYLEEERSMEMYCQMGIILFKVQEKKIHKCDVLMIINSIEFVDKIHVDVETEFFQQQLLVNEFSDFQSYDYYFDMGSQMVDPKLLQKKRVFQDKKHEKKIYFVRVPILCKIGLLKWWFYMKSTKSQDYWLRKNTHIVF